MRHLILFALTILIPALSYAQTGTVKGVVTDKNTGDAMFTTNVYLEGTATDGTKLGTSGKLRGGSVDIDGSYVITNIPVGTYTVVGTFVGYDDARTENIVVKEGETVVVDFTMEEGGATILPGATIKAKRVTRSENAMMGMQKRSVVVQDGISANEMSAGGRSNAADAAKQITGTSVVGGKYVYVRGLGDRYTAAQLNGAALTGTDPYVNSAPLDLIPSNLLDNMIVAKTATPDLPGNFSGGVVKLNTKDFPERMTLNFSNSISYNDQSSFNSNFLTHGGGGTAEWFGYNDGSRSLPSILNDAETQRKLSSPTYYIIARTDDAEAAILDETSKALNTQMEALPQQSFTNYSTAISFGNQYQVAGNTLGVIFGANHSRNYTHYEDAVNQAWDITGVEAEELFTYFNLRDTRSSENPVVAYMGGLTYEIGDNHTVGVLHLYNHDTEKISRYQRGSIPGIVSGSDKVFETRTLQFTERGLTTTQAKGSHFFPNLHNISVDWVGSITSSFQNEPDLRFFANETVGDSMYFISISEYDLPNHYFRELTDNSQEFRVDIKIPFTKLVDNVNYIKVGYRIYEKERDFEEYRFSIKDRDGEDYMGDQDAYFGPENTGVIGYDSIFNRHIIGNYVVNNSKISNNYTGRTFINAYYVMGVYEITKKLKFSGGGRLEQTIMNITSADTTQMEGDINQWNFFPSANLIFAYSDKTNIRGSYSQTIARPTMRELAPFVAFDFIGGFLYLGNPDLRTTQIDNYDLRWEHFPRTGEVIALSAYYKHFTDPIVKAYNTNAINPEIIFQNTNDADVFGFEFDYRKKLDFIGPKFKNFKFNVNFSYIISRVALDTSEYNTLAQINEEIDNYRPFQGQSPFLVNGILSYNNAEKKFSANLNYNFFGKRLAAIGLQGLPDVYDRARGMLNFQVRKQFGEHLNCKVGINNILNANYITLQTFRNEAYVNQEYRLGRTYSLGITYMIK